MFQSFFTGLSGMLSFSRNLDNVSNNIANMNTPGFKGSDTFYRSLTSGETALGTQVSGQSQRFTAGEIRQTGNASDLAIAGEGFFVLLQDGEVKYTRAGQFEFNESGQLVDSVSGGQVAAVDANGDLQAVDISNSRILAPQATSTVSLTGNLSTDMATHSLTGINVFNGIGEQQTLSIDFTNNSGVTAGSWLVEVKDSNGATIHNGEIRFGTDGTPVTNFNSLSFNITDSNGGTDQVTLNFGTTGSFAGSTSVSGGATSTIQATVDNGRAIAALTTVSFDANGTLQFNYSNGETVAGPTLALASFTNESALEIDAGSVFTASDASGATIGTAGQSGLGTIVAESIELSNVDLSREFADMIVIQRGYQASSRILNIANQLLDQLFENTRGR